MHANIKKIFWSLWLIASLLPYPVSAANGVPNSNSFGYGVRVKLHGVEPLTAIQEAGKFNLDWIAIDFNWQYMQAEAETPPNWQELDAAMALAAENQISVMISLTQPPTWVMDQDGPNAAKTSQLISNLVPRYADTLLALEIFPSANTIQGWGGAPNPQAYTQLIKTVSEMMQSIAPEVLIVGAGLTPVTSPAEGMDDLHFLNQAYAAGIAEYMPLVGVRLPALGSDPLTDRRQTEELTLRHYEDIRNIMSQNGHKKGLIWITGFSWDANTLATPERQAAWVKQAYLLFRSQLYIGAAFFDSLNGSHTEAAELLFEGGSYHPGFAELIQIVAQDRNEQTIIISIGLSKKLSNKNYQKASKP